MATTHHTTLRKCRTFLWSVKHVTTLMLQQLGLTPYQRRFFCKQISFLKPLCFFKDCILKSHNSHMYLFALIVQDLTRTIWSVQPRIPLKWYGPKCKVFPILQRITAGHFECLKEAFNVKNMTVLPCRSGGPTGLPKNNKFVWGKGVKKKVEKSYTTD